MSEKIILRNVTGNMVFNASGKIVDRGQDYDRLKEKHAAKDATLRDVKSFDELSDREYLVRVRDACIKEVRISIKESVSADTLVIQAVNHIEELNKAINTLSKRLFEWYSFALPELAKKISDQEILARMIAENPREKIMENLGITEEISMGNSLSTKDLAPIIEFANSIKQLYELKKVQEEYLDKSFKELAPNVYGLVGPRIGAKLVSLAGSLKHLSTFPSSTVQLLGAEKALFRHMVTGSRPPKHGVIHEHPLVGKAREKGRVSRALANKISIAAKVDYFKGEYIADKLKEELEARFG